jgi:hypothetical protein
LYNLLANLTALVHLLFVLFVVLGQVLVLVGWSRQWHWTRNRVFRWLHLGAILFVMFSTWFDMYCPLTLLESFLREAAGGQGYETGFIGDWLQRLLYYHAPVWAFVFIYTVFALIVIITFLNYPPEKKAKGSAVTSDR